MMNDKEYQRDIQELERNIYLEKLRSKDYLASFIKEISSHDKSAIVESSRTIVRYRIPLKVRWDRFKYKVSKMLEQW